jgi:general secretion pathway protein G
MNSPSQTSSDLPPPIPRSPDRRRALLWDICLAVGLVAFVALILLISRGITPLSKFRNEAKLSTTEAKVRTLEAALTQYKTLNGSYPTETQGLEALVTRPTSDRQPQRWTQLVRADALMDPWESKMQYRNPGKVNPSRYDIFSLGPDRVESPDDIGNW